MTPEDVYIPLAARVKLFEKGLGNGIKPTPINSQKQPNITSSPGTHRLTKPKSPQLLTRQRSFSSSHNCYRTDERSSVPQSPSVLENESSAKNIKHTNQRKHTEDQTYTINRDNSNNNSHRVNKRPYYSISSSSISTNKNDHHAKKGENKKQRRHDHPPLEVKPFQFATDKRAARYQELFRTKLKLWKEKENQEKPVPKRHK
ncbi:hypothetical protein BJ944DRAFT_7065 [Cunninghamella echinulata]|nr:hypothetical protein BJ944DRAFT_7065 [Cunninghamella echinulata]